MCKNYHSTQGIYWELDWVIDIQVSGSKDPRTNSKGSQSSDLGYINNRFKIEINHRILRGRDDPICGIAWAK